MIMTERILSPQLLKLVQAAGPGYSQANPEWVKKFAELIIQECCDIFVELRTRPADLAVKDVKKHFGVEE